MFLINIISLALPSQHFQFMINQSQIQEDSQQLYPQLSVVMSVISEKQDTSPQQREKQQFLREEIVDFFDSNQQIMELFSNYLLKYVKEKRGESIVEPDLDLLTMQELHEMVHAFKQRINQYQKEENEVKQPNRSKLFAKSIILDELCEEEPPKIFYKNGAWDYVFKLDSINCKRIKPFFNNFSRKISVSIVNSQVRKISGFLTKKVSLWIELNSKYLEKDMTVFRSIQDFVFLQDVLQRICPHSFVPMLNITKQELQEVEMEWVRVKITKKCQRFIQKIVQNEDFLENVYTFRFLAELKEGNYQQHRKDNESVLIKNAEEFKNLSGSMPCEISEEREKEKLSISRLSGFLNDKSKRISNLSLQIGQQMRILDESLANLIGQLKSINEAITKQQKNISYNCDPFTQLIADYREMVTITADTLHCCEQSFLKLKEAFVNKSVERWSQFNLYKNRLIKQGETYQRKRKQYLQTECIRIQGVNNSRPNPKVDLKIGLLNLSKNEAEYSWIQRQTIWYGHMNTSLVTTFSQFMQSQQQSLKESLKSTILELSNQLSLNSQKMAAFSKH